MKCKPRAAALQSLSRLSPTVGHQHLRPKMPAQFPPHPILPTRYIIYGTFIDAPTPAALRVRRDCEIVVDVTGTIESITKAKPREKDKDGEEVCYIKLKRGQVICPGLIDCVRICYPYAQRKGL